MRRTGLKLLCDLLLVDLIKTASALERSGPRKRKKLASEEPRDIGSDLVQDETEEGTKKEEKRTSWLRKRLPLLILGTLGTVGGIALSSQLRQYLRNQEQERERLREMIEEEMKRLQKLEEEIKDPMEFYRRLKMELNRQFLLEAFKEGVLL